jgi:hypothetical protein
MVQHPVGFHVGRAKRLGLLASRFGYSAIFVLTCGDVVFSSLQKKLITTPQLFFRFNFILG